MLPGIVPAMMMSADEDAPSEFSFITTVSGSRTGDGTLTFSSVDFGDPDSDRRIIVALSSTTDTGSGGVASTGHTIGGVSANTYARVTSTEPGGSGRQITSLFIEAIVPSGSTGNIALDIFSIGGHEVTVFGEVFRLVNPPASSPHDTATSSTDSSAFTSTSISVPEGGIGIVVGRIEGDGTEATVSGFSTLASSTGKQECKYETGLTADASKGVSCSSNGSSPEGVVVSALSWEFTS